MRKIFTLLFVILISTSIAQNQTEFPEPNLDFEIVENNKPAGWFTIPNKNYRHCIDSTTVYKGKYSLKIIGNGTKSDYFGSVFIIPSEYSGKEVKITAYIKTDLTENSQANLYIRIDPNQAYTLYNQNGITGSTEWTKYETSIAFNPHNATQIVVGAIVSGKGNVWIDNMEVYIDDLPLEKAKPLEQLAAEKYDEKIKDLEVSPDLFNKVSAQDLKLLGQVWGLIKYYHPDIAKGNYNWDYELIRFLPQYLNAKSKNERHQLLAQWLPYNGETKEVKINDRKVALRRDLDWISDKSLSPELQSYLNKILIAKRSDFHYYYLMGTASNVEIKNERAYDDMTFPDPAFRLLSLYRYWNIVQYFFPYRDVIGKDWKDVLEDYILEFISAKNEVEYKLAVLELMGEINDTHSNIWGLDKTLLKHWGENYAASKAHFIDDKLVVVGHYNDSLSGFSNTKIGDIITKINGVKVKKIMKERLKYCPASNYPTKLRDLAKHMLRSNDSIITLQIKRDKNKQIIDVPTYPFKYINVYNMGIDVYYTGIDIDTSFCMLDNNIAYINNEKLKKGHLASIWDKIKDTKGIIFDNRNYPEDYLIYDVPPFFTKKITPFVRITRTSMKTPGLFQWILPVYTGKRNKELYKGQVVILVNETSQSASEYHAMAYQIIPNAKVVGSQTAGADGNIVKFDLPGGIPTAISGIGVFYPDKKPTQRVGVAIDYEVKPTIEGVKAGRDELIEKAIQIITNDQ